MTPPSTSAGSNTAGSRYRRPLKWIGGSVLVLLLLFVFIVFVLPSPAARYVIESQLDRLGIEHDGVDTVHIDLWNSQVSAGPVEFRSGVAEAGQIGEVGFNYSFRALLKKQAFIQLFFVRGVDIYVRRGDDGLITLNGIDVAKVARDQEDARADEVATDEQMEPAIGAGVESFEFTDSRLVFEDFTGGTMTVEVKRLALRNFSTWEPDVAGTFELQGSVNGFELEWDGSARPLAEPITVELNTHMRGITLDKIAEFIGPTGLARQAGNLETAVHYNYAIHGDGRIEGTADGTYTLADVDFATSEEQSLRVGDAQLQVDVQQSYAADGSASTAGHMTLKTSPISLSSPNGDQIELGGIDFSIDELAFDRLAKRRVTEAGEQTGGTTAPTGSTPTVVELLTGWAEGLVRNALRHQLEIDGSPAIEVRGGQVRLAPREGIPGQELRFESFVANLGDIDSRTVGEGWAVTAALKATVDGFQAASEEVGSAANLAKVEIGSQSVDLTSDGVETTLSFDLMARLSGLDAKDGLGLKLALQSLETGTDGMTVIDRQQGGEIKGPISLRMRDIQATVPGADRTSLVTAESLSLQLPRMALEGEDVASAAFSGRLEIDALAIEDNAQLPVSFGLGSLQTDLKNFRLDKLSSDGTAEGSLTTKLDGLRLDVGEEGRVLAHSATATEIHLDRLTAQGGEAPTITLSGNTTVSQTRTTVPIGGGETAETTIETIQMDLSETSVVGTTTRSSGDIEATNMVTQSSGEFPQSIALESLSVKGMKSDPETATEIDAIQVGGLVAVLNNGLWGRRGQSSEAPTTESTADREGAEAEPAKTVPLRIGQFAILPGGRIELTDRSVDPPMKLDIEFQTLEVGPIDTGAPEIQTRIALDAAVNKTAKATIEGWATPLEPTPDFDLTTNVTAMSLPPFSPYASSAAGLDVESGDLTAVASATASGGALSGHIDVLVDDLYLEPVSDERAEGLESSLGVPVGFAVGILKNSEGQIDLGFPVSGTLEAPQVDYSEAISKAVSGAMASLFPTNWLGAGGSGFNIEPATFEAGSAEMTDQGKTVTDEIGELFADKPNITVRACGKATADDLVVLRGGEAPVRSESAEGEDESTADEGEAAATSSAGSAAAISKPNQQEVDALLSLATERSAKVREYLSSNFAIDPSRIPECRTSYSIEDGKPPRAEFRL